MRILILGGDGMLGHRLVRDWRHRHEVHATLHRPRGCYATHGLFDPASTTDEVDVRDAERVPAVLARVRPQAVVNAVGIVKQREAAHDPIASIEINALFPTACGNGAPPSGARLVHISTDCVFNGQRGNYREVDPADAEDLYGRTKHLGEVGAAPALTLRTSIIGTELSRKTGLVEWFLAARGRIDGYTRAIYTGLTTQELGRAIEHVLVERPQLTGLWHVASQPISKYQLLSDLAKRLGRRDVEIAADKRFHCDRSLDGTNFQQAAGYTAPDWSTMLDELAAKSRARENDS